jgi:hypothetical protein
MKSVTLIAGAFLALTQAQAPAAAFGGGMIISDSNNRVQTDKTNLHSRTLLKRQDGSPGKSSGSDTAAAKSKPLGGLDGKDATAPKESGPAKFGGFSKGGKGLQGLIDRYKAKGQLGDGKGDSLGAKFVNKGSKGSSPEIQAFISKMKEAKAKRSGGGAPSVSRHVATNGGDDPKSKAIAAKSKKSDRDNAAAAPDTDASAIKGPASRIKGRAATFGGSEGGGLFSKFLGGGKGAATATTADADAGASTDAAAADGDDGGLGGKGLLAKIRAKFSGGSAMGGLGGLGSGGLGGLGGGLGGLSGLSGGFGGGGLGSKL